MNALSCVSVSLPGGGYFDCENKVCRLENEKAEPELVKLGGIVPWLDNVYWSDALMDLRSNFDLDNHFGGWDLGVVNFSLSSYFPRGSAWPAIFSEYEEGFELDDREGCENLIGIAVDRDGDRMADLFLFNVALFNATAITSINIGEYLRPFNACYDERSDQTCGPLADWFRPEAFPFRGRMLPDSYGKITSMMMVAYYLTQDVIMQFMRLRPDIKYQILYPAAEEIPGNRSVIEDQLLAQKGFFLPARMAEFELNRLNQHDLPEISYSPYERKKCDFPPCGDDIWMRDQYYIGRNEFDETFAAVRYVDEFRKYIEPLVHRRGVRAMLTDEYHENGNMLTTSTHIFTTMDWHRPIFSGRENFLQTFASGLKLISIDLPQKSYALDLDEVITPLEEVRDGKKVVLVAEGEEFDRVEVQLADEFSIYRLPYEESSGVGYTYNNVLIERYAENSQLVRKVYMPWYRYVGDLNEQAAAVYYQFGYEVIPIDGLDRLVQLSGALHCVTKETGRDHLEDWF